ncbi:ATP-dependent Lhr-like helicase [Vibrio diazotrophicus]|uniref:ATP-dependent Lhr-like helicase n=1 Tax=Vibrio diazotrophicus TaxID=685 RepID=A0A329E949_VIBDI|nr:DEAD/DEAH box helicase [Vibrio diazotrophicus]RAS63562.1 ATP-dependent Lhr-like helicase [Vibrio diazotrophicus]
MIDIHKLLDYRVQKWIFKQGWSDLREIQKKAIQPILSGNTDVLISASTAAGKTEAFFLPACSATADKTNGFGIVYISPLKALINDQYRRLESLCELLDMPVTPWHGDSSQSLKNKARKTPAGILLITPESLESLLIRDPGWLKLAFESLQYIVIDEFHAFIGSERGHHLLSILNRIEHLLGRFSNPIPRVALSATLGELDKVPLLLRPNQSIMCELITDEKYKSQLSVKVHGYVEQIPTENETQDSAEYQICQKLFQLCRGDSHLVFANSRKRTESIAVQLRDLCEQQLVPNEFFPHHGSLSKESREELERRLQKDTIPTTAICTMTLELGIDIGKVSSVVQVTAPHSVSSLRQRMGRSGRRGSPPILRMLIAEDELSEHSSIIDCLRLELIQSLAMIRLLIQNQWFEPADNRLMHFSTLLHQVLALVAQWGGVRADQLFELLCKKGPFQHVSTTQFKMLLQHMGSLQLLTQLSSGELVLGVLGERVVDHYSFYAVFKTPEEYRIIEGNKALGTLPIDSLIIEGQHIVFSGRRWKVVDVDTDKKTIQVKQTKGGKPPKFGGDGMSIHTRVRQEMFTILSEGDYRISVGQHKVDFIDNTAKALFDEASTFFQRANLSNQSVIKHGSSTYIFTWMGDKVVNTLVALLKQNGFESGAFGGVIGIEKTTVKDIMAFLTSLNYNNLPTESELAELVKEKKVDKFDEYLPDSLLIEGYGSRAFDIHGTTEWLNQLK